MPNPARFVDIKVSCTECKQNMTSLRGQMGQNSGLYYKCFTIVIYDHNDSGQYYKTTIMIIIDDPS